MRFAWKAPIVIGAGCAVVLLLATRPSNIADVAFVVGLAVALGFAITAVGSWP